MYPMTFSSFDLSARQEPRNSSMLRLFEDKAWEVNPTECRWPWEAEAGEVVKAVPLQDNLPLQAG